MEDYFAATSQIAQTTLRSVLGKAELDSLLAERERLNEDLQKVIDQQTEPWGVKVTTVEIKDVEIPRDMQRAIARQAEAERERRAKIINAEAEFQASARLAEAADIISRNPTTLQLRYLQTLGSWVGRARRRWCFRCRSIWCGLFWRGTRCRRLRRARTGPRCGGGPTWSRSSPAGRRCGPTPSGRLSSERQFDGFPTGIVSPRSPASWPSPHAQSSPQPPQPPA